MSMFPPDEVSYFHFNKIFVIESTPRDERQTGKELFDDLLSRAPAQHPWFMSSYRFVESRKQLFRWLASIKREVVAGGIYPLVHLEAHGNRQGLEVGAGSKQVVIKWEEINDELRKINIATRNNLLVTVATCFGAYIYKGIDPGERAPYYGFIAPLDKVSPDELLEGFQDLFDRIIRTDQFDEAVLVLRGAAGGGAPRFTYQHCETTFRFVIENMGTAMRDPTYRAKKALELTVKSLGSVNVRLNNTVEGIVDYYQNYVSRSDEHLKQMLDHFLMKDMP